MADGIGTLTFTELASSRRYSSTAGWSIVRRWNGHKDNLDAFLNANLPDGYQEYSIEIEGKVAVVTATYAGSSPTDSGGAGSTPPDPIKEGWSLSGQMVEISLWQHPDVLSQYAQLPDWARAGVISEINRGLEGNLAASELDFPLIKTSPRPSNYASGVSPFRSLYERLLVGIESMPRSQYTLRKVLTVGAYSQLKASHTKVNHILTYSQLLQTEPNWQVSFLVNAAGLSKYVWLKTAPSIDPIDRGQFQISQEYVGFKTYDAWIHLDWNEPEPAETRIILTANGSLNGVAS